MLFPQLGLRHYSCSRQANDVARLLRSMGLCVIDANIPDHGAGISCLTWMMWQKLVHASLTHNQRCTLSSAYSAWGMISWRRTHELDFLQSHSPYLGMCTLSISNTFRKANHSPARTLHTHCSPFNLQIIAMSNPMPCRTITSSILSELAFSRWASRARGVRIRDCPCSSTMSKSRTELNKSNNLIHIWYGRQGTACSEQLSLAKQKCLTCYFDAVLSQTLVTVKVVSLWKSQRNLATMRV